MSKLEKSINVIKSTIFVVFVLRFNGKLRFPQSESSSAKIVHIKKEKCIILTSKISKYTQQQSHRQRAFTSQQTAKDPFH